MKEPPTPANGKSATAAEDAEQPTLKDFFPAWACILGAGVVGIVVLSVVARLMLPAVGPERVILALAQCVAGFIMAATGQVLAFLYAASKSDRFSPFDVLMKPIEIWKPSTRMLPQSAPRFWLAAWGVTAILCGVLIVGGLRYNALFEDWGIEKQASLNLVQEIVKKAREEQEGGADSLEGAMNDFVGEEEEKDKNDIDKLPTVDCLIFGYVERDNGEVESVLLATLIGKEVSYVGQSSIADMPEESRFQLIGRMRKLERRAPFVKTTGTPVATLKGANWLQPVLMCRIAYTEWDGRSELIKPRLKHTLADAAEK